MFVAGRWETPGVRGELDDLRAHAGPHLSHPPRHTLNTWVHCEGK